MRHRRCASRRLVRHLVYTERGGDERRLVERPVRKPTVARQPFDARPSRSGEGWMSASDKSGRLTYRSGTAAKSHFLSIRTLKTPLTTHLSRYINERPNLGSDQSRLNVRNWVMGGRCRTRRVRPNPDIQLANPTFRKRPLVQRDILNPVLPPPQSRYEAIGKQTYERKLGAGHG